MDEDADTGGAERAFEALRAEVVALRQVIEEQAAPDYALTLGAIARELETVATADDDRGSSGAGDDTRAIFRATHRRRGAGASGRRQSDMGRPDTAR